MTLSLSQREKYITLKGHGQIYFYIWSVYIAWEMHFQWYPKIWVSVVELKARCVARNSLSCKHGSSPVFVYSGSIYFYIYSIYIKVLFLSWLLSALIRFKHKK